MKLSLSHPLVLKLRILKQRYQARRLGKAARHDGLLASPQGGHKAIWRRGKLRMKPHKLWNQAPYP